MRSTKIICDLADDLEACREMSHAYVQGRELGFFRNTLTVRSINGGRVRFGIDTSAGDGWSVPFNFTPLSQRPYNKDNQAPCLISVYGDVSGDGLDVPEAPGYAVPVLDPTLLHEGVEATDYLNGRLVRTVQKMFRTFLTPYLYVAARQGTQDYTYPTYQVCMPSYDLDQNTPYAYVVKNITNRRRRVPTIQLLYDDHEDQLRVTDMAPTKELLAYLRDNALPSEQRFYDARLSAIMLTFDAFKAYKLSSVLDLYTKYRVPLASAHLRAFETFLD
ncbi:MAG: hypothetical protein EBR81_14730 [Proteobacteria bacterium]|nr:hypothetical protein [Pseudomonadota bacterium]